jgi:hypothetical protein
MRQWLVNVHCLRAKRFKLETLVLPERLARQRAGTSPG